MPDELDLVFRQDSWIVRAKLKILAETNIEFHPGFMSVHGSVKVRCAARDLHGHYSSY